MVQINIQVKKRMNINMNKIKINIIIKIKREYTAALIQIPKEQASKNTEPKNLPYKNHNHNYKVKENYKALKTNSE